MATRCDNDYTTQINYFSNPDVSFTNNDATKPTGSASADNAQVIRNNMVRPHYIRPWCHN